MAVHTTRLANGTRVVSEWMPAVETVSLGVWLPFGSRHEQENEGGLFHFIEHTLFKGTPTRGARKIAEDVDALGAYLDAYTAKEDTCYSFKVRARHLPKLLEILADMLHNPVFAEDELDRERQVILEEIKMEEDNPEDLAYESNQQCFWRRHPIGRPILGRAEQVAAFRSDQVKAFHQRFYGDGNMVVSAAGKIDHQELCRLITELFPGREACPDLHQDATHQPLFETGVSKHHRPHLEQVNFNLSFPTMAYTNPDREVLYVLNGILGGNMSARLFQKIREEHGLSYSIGSYGALYSDCGLMSIYGGCSPGSLDKVLHLIDEVLRTLLQDGVSPEELSRSREQLVSANLMGMETTGARASSYARDLMLLGKPQQLDVMIEEVESVTAERVMDLARAIFCDGRSALSLVGPVAAYEPFIPLAHMGVSPSK